MPVKTKTTLVIAIAAAVWLVMLSGIVVTVIVLLKPEAAPPVPAPETIATEPEAPSILTKNPYSPEDFAYVNDFLTCTAGESILGIDVSSHQSRSIGKR